MNHFHLPVDGSNLLPSEPVKIITRYLLREVLTHALLGLLLFSFVIFMRDVGRLLEVVVRSGSGALLVALLYALPSTFVFTVPMAVLAGILVGLNRWAADQEIVALRAAGAGLPLFLRPLLAFAGVALALALFTTLVLAPAGALRLQELENGLRGSQAGFEVQPRVFLENIPNLVVYVDDVVHGGRGWRRVFVADMKDPAAPRITMARGGALLSSSPSSLQLHLENGISYEDSSARPDTLLVSSFQQTDLPLLLPAPRAGPPSLPAAGLGQLWTRMHTPAEALTAGIEFHRRLALAFACLALALVGIPIGLTVRRGGKANGFVLALALVLAYYLVFVTGIALARQGRVPVALGVWAADLLFMTLGVGMMFGVNRVPRRMETAVDPVARLRAALAAWWARTGKAQRGLQRNWLPLILDGYVVREFVGYMGFMLAGFLVLVLVFTFFDLLGDIIKHRAGVVLVARYLAYLTPQLFYVTAPVAILVGVLVTFGLMSKSNEITALKAGGVSVHRLILPVLAVAGLLCTLQFVLNETALPGFNRTQDALRAQIKGRPPQTYLRPERKWIFGQSHDLFYFQIFDPYRREFANLSVLRFDPATFELTERIQARAAHWDQHINGWVFEDGWVRTLNGDQVTGFERFQVAGFPVVQETPAYFTTEARESTQMSYLELRRYVQELRRSGYDVGRLSVQLQKKLAYPLITLIMALLGFPFALTVGRRGAVSGLAVAVGVGIVYWVSAGLLEALGNLNQLPAGVAAWAPDCLFAVAAAYLLLRVPT